MTLAALRAELPLILAEARVDALLALRSTPGQSAGLLR